MTLRSVDPTPGVRSEHIARANRAVELLLGVSGVEMWDYRFHSWTGSIVFVAADGDRFVCKVPFDVSITTREAENLRVLSQEQTVVVPQLVGEQDGVLVETFIAGASPSLTSLNLRRQGTNVAESLATLHAVAVTNELKERIFTFPQQSAITSLSAAKHRALEELEPRVGPNVLKSLRAWEPERVKALWKGGLHLSHGDFKTENLIVGPANRVYLVDLLRLHLGSPWLDLAHFAMTLPVADRQAWTSTYLKAAHQQGLHLDVGGTEAQELSQIAHDAKLVEGANFCVKNSLITGATWCLEKMSNQEQMLGSPDKSAAD